MRETFDFVRSSCVPLRAENVDTDQIIPARFLKATSREGFGKNLFRDWRYDQKDQPISSFILNQNIYSGKILVTGKNFGCGSSREHAVWALYDYGFRVVISSFFADIFKNNSLNNFLLPIQVSEDVLQKLFSLIENNPQEELEVDIQNQLLSVPKQEVSISFDLNPYKKMCFLKGYDDIDYLLNHLPDVEKYEAQSPILRVLK